MLTFSAVYLVFSVKWYERLCRSLENVQVGEKHWRDAWVIRWSLIVPEKLMVQFRKYRRFFFLGLISSEYEDEYNYRYTWEGRWKILYRDEMKRDSKFNKYEEEYVGTAIVKNMWGRKREKESKNGRRANELNKQTDHRL